MIPPSIEQILLHTEHPARYSGGELFQTVKTAPEVRVAISYPDLYEIGMANHGLKILYDGANKVNGAACERVFAVAPDFAGSLRKNGIKLYTLETFTPLDECDMIGFNLSHELLYTNVLQILDLGGVPLLASERGEHSPIVIFGGECVSNHAPVSAFADLVFAGEGDDGFPEAVAVLRDCRREKFSRDDTISKLCDVEGIFRPADANKKRRIYRGEPADPVRPVIPSIRITHDKGVVEAMRGCSNLCKFCHAGYYNLPHRSFDPKKVADKARSLVKNTGYNEITFLSLSISDYREVVTLLNDVLPEFNEHGISVSLPSLKVDLRTLPIISVTSDIRKSSVTFAVETGSEEMRQFINKKLSIDEFCEIVERIFSGKWEVIKLYFMLGLPGFREHDEAQAIIDLLNRVDAIGRKRKKINATLSPFIPKPHTPFEREEMAGEEYLLETVKKIKSVMPRRISIKNHQIRSSRLEGLLSRGDEALSTTILQAYKNGAVLDSWDEHVNYDAWDSAIAATIPDTGKYYAKRADDAVLPWSDQSSCYEATKKAMMHYRAPETTSSVPFREAIDAEKIREGFERFKKKYAVVSRCRFVFAKTGRSKFISHLDFMEIIRRGFRIIGVPVSFSQGFNKHERISAGFPLPLGVESLSEIIDVDLYDAFSFDTSVDQSVFFPEGVRIVSFENNVAKESVMALTSGFRCEVTFTDPSHAEALGAALSEKRDIIKKEKTGLERAIPFDVCVHSWERTGDTFTIDLYAGKSDAIRVDHLVAKIIGSDRIPAGCSIVKKCQLKSSAETGSLAPM
jgi:radical SAM-linked protein